MNRFEIAALWRQVARHEPGPVLRMSGKLYDRAHEFDRLPQPGFVGKNYREGGLLVLAQNPAAGGDGLSSGDIEQYKLIDGLRICADNEVERRFERLMDHLVIFMASWNIIRNNGINVVLGAHRKDLSDICYLNVCKFRTINSDLGNSILDESWIATKEQTTLLQPGRILVLGKGLWSWFSSKGHDQPDDLCIPRTRGDLAPAPEAIPILKKLAQGSLLPR